MYSTVRPRAAARNEIRYYNGFTQEQVGGAYGLQKLGIHNCRPFFTRGILLDVARYKGVDRLAINYIITLDDVMGTCAWSAFASPERAMPSSSTPGTANSGRSSTTSTTRAAPIPARRWRTGWVDKKIAVVGADTWAVEAGPGEDANRPFECLKGATGSPGNSVAMS